MQDQNNNHLIKFPEIDTTYPQMAFLPGMKVKTTRQFGGFERPLPEGTILTVSHGRYNPENEVDYLVCIWHRDARKGEYPVEVIVNPTGVVSAEL